MKQKSDPTYENVNSTNSIVNCLICPSCGNSDKYVKYYNEDMICNGCGYDLGQSKELLDSNISNK